MENKKGIELYLNRYATESVGEDVELADRLEMIVVIPSHDEPNLLKSLQSLDRCPVEQDVVMVIVIINASIQAPSEVKQRNCHSHKEALSWVQDYSKGHIQYHFVLENEMAHKHAGVGLARKIGMDLATRFFYKLDKNGIIVCFDADSLCEKNYLEELLKYFSANPKMPGCSIHFEHPLTGSLSEKHYEAITNYELHLRYYINALRFSGFPGAFQTIGSSMAVRTNAYALQGGMNRRKAGEDFYFLHRIIALGDFGELKTTMVIPSSRQSHRVPFGTGRAVGNWIEAPKEEFLTYNPLVFVALKDFLDNATKLFHTEDFKQFEGLPASISEYLDELNFADILVKIRKNSSNERGFLRAFFQWFDAFKILKYVHFARDHFHPNVPVIDAIVWLHEVLGERFRPGNNLSDHLIQLRYYDKQ